MRIDRAVLEGGVRIINDDTRELVKEKMEQAVANVCNFYVADYDFFHYGYAAVINVDDKTIQIRNITTELFSDRVFEFPLQRGERILQPSPDSFLAHMHGLALVIHKKQ